ncbi:MAG: response regulator, partial [Phaeobacter gallaeciensis]
QSSEPSAEDPAQDELDWSNEVLQRHRWRVLAAEDNLTNQLVLRHLLKEFDLDLTILPDGAELCALWRAGGADLILMDVNMPVMDGVAATGEIRRAEREEGRAPVPIIAISANAMAHQIEGYLAQGMTAHVAKPTRKSDLVAAMARALAGSSLP